MNIEDFSRQIKARRIRLTRRLQSLEQSIPESEHLKAALEEFKTALAELKAAEEALSQQNQVVKKARKALETERQRYQEPFQLAPDGYLITNTSGTIQEANRAAASLLNVSQQHLIGKPLVVFVTDQERLNFSRKLTQLKQSKSVIKEWEINLQPRHNSPISTSVTVASVLDHTGKIVRICWLFRDITEQKQTESALQQSEARCRRLVESNIIGSMVADFSGNITEANDAFLEMVGYTKEDLNASKLRWHNMTPPEYYSRDQQAIAQVKKSGACTPYEKEFIAKNGNRVPILLGLACLEGTIDAFICFVLDLTQIKQLEQELRQQTEELAQANRMKDEFLAVMSHELRSPLTAILGWSQLLQNSSPTSATNTRAIEMIVHNAKVQTQLIDDLLDVSNIITGKLRLNVHPIEPAPIIKAAINSVCPAATAKQIQIESDLAPISNLVLADSERLQQVMWNLLVNAIKFTPQGGYVQVRLASIDSLIEITVSDSGIGISPEFLPFVFERFRQADSTNTRAYGGMGLGLALVRHLVEMHGGTVQVASRGKGQGTSFTVKLPVWQQQTVIESEFRTQESEFCMNFVPLGDEY